MNWNINWNMLIMVGKGIRGEICHCIFLFIDMQKVITNVWKIYDKSKESSNWGVNFLHGWAMSQKLPVKNFKCV